MAAAVVAGLPLDEELELEVSGGIFSPGGGVQESGAGGVLEEGGVLDGDLAAAEGAAGMGLQPAVHTTEVEGVLALGQQPEELGVVESREADRALEAGAGAVEGGEAEEGQRLDDRPVDAGEAAVVEQDVTIGSVNAGGVGGEELGGGGVAEFSIHKKKKREREHEGENSDDDGDARPERHRHPLGVLLARLRGADCPDR